MLTARELELSAADLRQRFERLRLDVPSRVRIDAAIIDAWCEIDPPLSSIADEADLTTRHVITLVDRPRSVPSRRGRTR